MNDYIRTSKKGHVGTIVFDRPKANCYDTGFMQQFHDAIDKVNADTDVRVVVINSDLERFFSSGADIKAFEENSTETNKSLVELARGALAKIESSGKIYIASINAHALGGGLEIAMACDLRIGGDGDYLIGLPEVKLGLMPGNGGSQRLSRIVGPGKALELVLTGDSIGPREAHRIGLINRLFPTDQLESETTDFAQSLARGAPLAMAAIKQSVFPGYQMPLKEGLTLEASQVDTLYDTADADEGFKAFKEKRPPEYRGR